VSDEAAARQRSLTEETQPMDVLPSVPDVLPPAPEQWSRPHWNQWQHNYPLLVATMAAHADVPESEVVDHLRELFMSVTSDPKVLPLQVHPLVLRQYLNEYVAVG
jgi:hypothetical protein